MQSVEPKNKDVTLDPQDVLIGLNSLVQGLLPTINSGLKSGIDISFLKTDFGVSSFDIVVMNGYGVISVGFANEKIANVDA